MHTNLVAISISAVVSLLTSALYNEWREKRATRRDVTFRLYDEWHSPDMLKARLRTDEILRWPADDGTSGLPELIVDMSDDWMAVSLVVHYFERVGLLLRARRTDRSLLKQTLGHYIESWKTRLLALPGAPPFDQWPVLERALQELFRYDWGDLRA